MPGRSRDGSKANGTGGAKGGWLPHLRPPRLFDGPRSMIVPIALRDSPGCKLSWKYIPARYWRPVFRDWQCKLENPACDLESLEPHGVPGPFQFYPRDIAPIHK